jgi:hypothetical protein
VCDEAYGDDEDDDCGDGDNIDDAEDAREQM